MAESTRHTIYEFGNFRLIPGEGLLLRDGLPIPLSPKVFATLLLLVERRGHLVPKAELMDKVWENAFVEENAVSKSVWSIRNALGEHPKSNEFIQTVPKRGYRFVATVNELVSDGAEDSSEDIVSNGDGKGVVTVKPYRSTASAPKVLRSNWYLVGIGLVLIASLVIILGLSSGEFGGWFPGTREKVAIRSLTVLPLENVSGDAGEEYFVDGMTETLISDLARISELRVISLPSAMRRDGIRGDLTQVGRDLNVDGLLTGSVARSGDRVRIAVQLVHASTGQNVWAGNYERDLKDVQSLQKDVARSIAREISTTVSPQELERLGSVRQVDPEAYDQYLRGRFYLNRQNRKDQDTAIIALERAVEIDPTFAVAQGELAQAYIWKHFSFAPDEPELAEKAFVATEKALSLDPGSAVAYLARGRLLWTPANHFPHEKAIRDYRRALELNPSLDEARNQLALVYCHIGLLDEALHESHEGVKINPTNNLLQLRIGQSLNSQTKYEEALAVLRTIPNEVHPSMIGHQTVWALLNLGRKEDAAAKIEQLLKENPDAGGTFASIKAVMAASAGRDLQARALIKQAIEKGKGFGHFHHTAYTIACAYALMNNRDEALKYLEIASETGYPCYPLFEKDANLDNLRQDPRFAAFLERSKAQWEYYRTLI